MPAKPKIPEHTPKSPMKTPMRPPMAGKPPMPPQAKNSPPHTLPEKASTTAKERAFGAQGKRKRKYPTK